MAENEMRNPDIQIQVVAEGSEVASICFWLNAGVHDGFDVAIAVDASLSVGNLRTLLASALQAVNAADWHDVDELAALAGEESESSPF